MTMTTTQLGPFNLEKVFGAMNEITARMIRAATALEAAGVPYAVIGGNAVANWVSRVDEALVRFTKDVDLLMRAEDLDAAETALTPVGIHCSELREGTGRRFVDGIHITLAKQKVRPEYLFAAPDVDERERGQDYYVLNLDALIRMKLTSNRDHDRTHIRDMISAGLIDQTWLTRVPPELAERLQYCLDTPDG